MLACEDLAYGWLGSEVFQQLRVGTTRIKHRDDEGVPHGIEHLISSDWRHRNEREGELRSKERRLSLGQENCGTQERLSGALDQKRSTPGLLGDVHGLQRFPA